MQEKLLNSPYYWLFWSFIFLILGFVYANWIVYFTLIPKDYLWSGICALLGLKCCDLTTQYFEESVKLAREQNL